MVLNITVRCGLYATYKKKSDLAAAELVLLTTQRTAPIPGTAGKTQQALQQVSEVSRTYPA